MAKEKLKIFDYLHVFVDFFILNSVFILAYVIKFKTFPSIVYSNPYTLLQIFVNFDWLISFVLKGYYSFENFTKYYTGFRRLVKSYIVFILLYLLFIIVIKGHVYSRLFHFYFLSIGFFLFFLNGVLINLLIYRTLKKHKFQKNILIVSNKEDELKNFIEKMNHSVGYNLFGIISNSTLKNSELKEKYLGNLDNFEEVIKKIKESGVEIDEIIISSSLQMEKIQEIVKIAEKNVIPVSVKLTLPQTLLHRPLDLYFVDGMPVIELRRVPLSYLHNQIIKRLFDIFFSLLIIITVFPIVFLIAAVGIKLNSPGPIFFKHLRKGFRGKPFVCYKFRTMKVTEESRTFVQAKFNDPRKFKFGHFLRRTSLDEIPQFINVLKGEMSVVGPRPHPIELDEMYTKLIEEYNVRFFAKPGITGWAQINGYRGETPNVEIMRKRIEHDIWYIENWSFWLDMKIILITIFKLLKGDPKAY